MWRWRRVAVARVFALVVRCRVKLLLVYSRVGKNRDTRRESPAGAGAACAASHRTVLFSQKILAAQKPMTYTDLLAVVSYILQCISRLYLIHCILYTCCILDQRCMISMTILRLGSLDRMILHIQHYCLQEARLQSNAD